MKAKRKAGSTQDKLEKSLKKAATKKQKQKESDVTVKEYKAPKISRTKEEDDEWLQSMEKNYADLKKRKAQTTILTMAQFGFLLEMARE